jgi:D-glycero-beta-D-manno-heptose-7-phosphate kinase
VTGVPAVAQSGAFPLGSARARKLVGLIAGRRLLVLGDVILDTYIHGEVERISPEAPVPVLRVERREHRPGGAANVAANAAALGATVTLVGGIATDEGGSLLLACLRARGISTDHLVEVRGRPTTVKTRLTARGQQLLRFDTEIDAHPGPEVADELMSRVEEVLSAVDAIAIEDYDKGVMTPALARRVIRAASDRGIPVVVDPKRRNFFAYEGATVFKPNLREVGDALGGNPRPKDAGWLDEVRRRTGAENLLLTMGEGGVVLCNSSGAPAHLPATARSVYDVSGAGDTVTAVMALILAVGGSPLEGAALANVAAGIQVGKAGVATIETAELLATLAD